MGTGNSKDSFVNLAEYREEVEKDFATVRILVIGKSAAGKSALIRRLFRVEHDVEGPKEASGRPGNQDISQEWHHPNLPIVIHDSNGVDSVGSKSVATVEKFLNARQRDPVFSRRIHLVWYVFSVLDNRILDNAGLLKVVTRPQYKLSSKLQLIATHNDEDMQGKFYARNVEQHLDGLLEQAGLSTDAQAAQALKDGLVQVSNGSGSTPDDTSRVDLEALQQLSVKTMAFLQEEQGMSWAAAQAVDMAGSNSAAGRIWRMKEILYARFVNLAEFREEVKKDFAPVHILVIGRSGAGKSSLIRRLFRVEHDVEGPKEASGRPGNQDISKEWHHPNLPIVIHDSNGVDSVGSKSVATVEKFLNARQRDRVLSRRIHLVWYVFSVFDNRILDNAGLLKVVTRPKYNLSSKLQLIATHNDMDTQGAAYATNVEQNLDGLLEQAGLLTDAQAAQALKDGLVKVSNCSGSSLDDTSMVDVEALKQLSAKTMAVLQGEQGRSWAGAQAVNVEEKVLSSAKFIVRRRLWTVLTAPLGVTVKMNKWRMEMLLAATISGLCRMWAVPLRFEQTFLENLALDPKTLKPADSTFANTVWATISPGGIPDGQAQEVLEMSPALVVAGASSINEAYAFILNYAMTVVGGIVYAKALHPSSLSGESASTFSERQYQAILDSFAATHQSELQKKAKEARSIFLEPFDQDSQSLKLEKLLTDFVLSLLEGPPTVDASGT